MLESTLWFFGQIFVCLLMLVLGARLGSRGGRGALLAMGVCLTLLFAWGLRIIAPTLYLNVIPLDVLVYIEGTANVPIFMLFIGLVWRYPHDARARRAGPPLIALACFYFLWNGMWMVMPYAQGKESLYEPFLHPAAHGGVITQYSHESCVAAAAATAMLAAGINKPVSEAEMIRLTDTRVLRGSTVARAARGLRRHLADTGIKVDVVDVNADGAANLASLDMPVLAPLRSGIGSLHMVVIYGHPPRLMDVFAPLDSRKLDWWTRVTTGKGFDRTDAALDAAEDHGDGIVRRRVTPPEPLFRFAVRWFAHFPSDLRDYVIVGNPMPEESDVAVNVPPGIQVMRIERFRKIYAGPTIFFHHAQ